MDIDAVNLLQTRVAENKVDSGQHGACKDIFLGGDCGYDVSTPDGENHCLNTESSGWSSWDCKGTNGRSAFAPDYCTSNFAPYRFMSRICCPHDCIPADEVVLDLTTPVGQNACIVRWLGNTWNDYDCDGGF